MGQSFSRLAVHIVFGTKHRYPFIDRAIEPELHAYLGGVCKALDCPPVAIGGVADHVHILCFLSKKIPLMDLLEELKKRSSKWIKTKGNPYRNFYWQDGYAAFSVRSDNMNRLIQYIRHQHEHHRTSGYMDELPALLMQNHLPFDEKYLWD